jgi:ribonucleoside-diphosphate reductase alpha chain
MKGVSYKELKKKWISEGEIPPWYSTNALQFFMQKYSYRQESVRSRMMAVATYLEKYAPHIKPDWWEEDEYTKGKTWGEVFFNLNWDGYAVPSTPLFANAGVPDRGMTVSCSGQDLQNSIASKSFMIGELEQLIKNSHGCSVSLEDWLAEGDIYDSDGNISEGILPIIKEIQEKTASTNQGIRRGQTLIGIGAEHGDFWKVASYLEEHNADLNIAWIIRDSFIEKLNNEDEEVLQRLARMIQLRMKTGKGYFTKVDTMNRNKAEVFKLLDMEVKGSNLCNEVNLPVTDKYSFTCVIYNANLLLWDKFPKHFFQLLHIMQDCNVSGYLDQIDAKKGLSRLFLNRVYDFTKDFRAVGSGVCGFHSLLMEKEIAIGDIESYQLNAEIFSTMQSETRKANIWLADVMGVPEGIKRSGLHLRNATTMFAPPTKSSTELAFGSPSEGVGMQTGMVKVKESTGGDLLRIESSFLKVMKRFGKYNQEEVNRIAQMKGSVQSLEWLPDNLKRVHRVGFEVPMEAHLNLCSQRQPFYDQQQSINLWLSGGEDEEYIGEIHKQALLDDNINGLYYCYSTRGGVFTRIKECEVCQ